MRNDPVVLSFRTEVELVQLEEGRFGEEFAFALSRILCKPGPSRRYVNYHQGGGGVFVFSTDEPYSTGSRRSSRLVVEPHKLTIEESDTDKTPEQFADEVVAVLGASAEAAGEVGRPCPPAFVQRCRVRCTDHPSHHGPLVLLAGVLSRSLGPIAPFRRPPSDFGVKFRFPPFREEDKRQALEMMDEEAVEVFDQENPLFSESFVTVRFETTPEDREAIWMEASTTQPFSEDLVELTEYDRFRKPILEAHGFVTNECVAFLDQFDRPPTQPEEDEDEDPEQPE